MTDHSSKLFDEPDPTGLLTAIARAVDGGARERENLLDIIEALTSVFEHAEIIRRRDRLAAVPQSTRAATDTSPTAAGSTPTDSSRRSA